MSTAFPNIKRIFSQNEKLFLLGVCKSLNEIKPTMILLSSASAGSHKQKLHFFPEGFKLRREYSGPGIRM